MPRYTAKIRNYVKRTPPVIPPEVQPVYDEFQKAFPSRRLRPWFFPKVQEYVEQKGAAYVLSAMQEACFNFPDRDGKAVSLFDWKCKGNEENEYGF